MFQKTNNQKRITMNILLKIISVLVSLYQTNAQINLNRTNIAGLCDCYPFNSTVMTLSRKNISSIDPVTFNGLTFLKTLDLSFNKIASLNETVFGGLSSLYELNLENNQLISLSSTIFSGLSS